MVSTMRRIAATASTLWAILASPRFALHQNVPNPFNARTLIDYAVPTSGRNAQIRIFDISGHLVRTLVDAEETPGYKSVVWDGLDSRGRRVATGVYLYRLTGRGFTETRRLTLLQ